MLTSMILDSYCLMSDSFFCPILSDFLDWLSGGICFRSLLHIKWDNINTVLCVVIDLLLAIEDKNMHSIHTR